MVHYFDMELRNQLDSAKRKFHAISPSKKEKKLYQLTGHTIKVFSKNIDPEDAEKNHKPFQYLRKPTEML